VQHGDRLPSLAGVVELATHQRRRDPSAGLARRNADRVDAADGDAVAADDRQLGRDRRVPADDAPVVDRGEVALRNGDHPFELEVLLLEDAAERRLDGAHPRLQLVRTDGADLDVGHGERA
jgi:hypothetical protein